MNNKSYGWEEDDSSDWSDTGDWSDWSDIDQSDFVALTRQQFLEVEIKEETSTVSSTQEDKPTETTTQHQTKKQ